MQQTARKNLSITQVVVCKVSPQSHVRANDAVTVEEPLEIRLQTDAQEKPLSVAVTMRTPGHDHELALGFLWSEGVVSDVTQIADVKHLGPRARQNSNIVQVNLKGAPPDFARLQRNFYTTSSCGVCGKASLDAVEEMLETIEYSQDQSFRVKTAIIHKLPQMLRAQQNAFEQTGGLHATALFDAEANLKAVFEDVGRHNALDKLIGSQIMQNCLPLRDTIIFVSGRASFELVQKTLMAGAPVLAAVGAPSSLAVDLAKRFNLTLLGFVRDERFNVYSGFERII